jgi:hypothetical protein
MGPVGKGYYIWKIPNCENGDPEAIAQTAYAAGLKHVLIKIANGIYDYNYDPTTKQDLIAPVIHALHNRHIEVWGWHYVFGDLPKDEAKAAIRQINRLPLDGYVIDAESEYKNKYTPCRIFMKELRNELPDFPIALSSFRYPKYHMELPWKDFLTYCDINMPQVYWEQSHNPAYQLEQSLSEFKSTIEPFKPIFPSGAAYCAGGWCPTPDEMIEFMDKAISLNMTAVNFWSWDYCRLKLPQLWNTIASYNWPSTPNPQKDIAEIFIDTLNSKIVSNIVDLYTSDAIHINSNRTVQGHSSLKTYYSDFLNNIQLNVTFEIDTIEGSDQTKHFSWRLLQSTTILASGEDTIGISSNKIIYHYTSSNL